MAAQAPPSTSACVQFGCQGQVSLSGGAGASVALVQQIDSRELVTDVELWFSPSISYFVADQIDLGASLLLESRFLESGFGLDEHALGAGLGAGAYLPLSAGVGLWPRASLFGVFRRRELFVPPGFGDPAFPPPTQVGVLHSHALDAVLELPLLLHLSPHLFLGIGAYVSFEVASSDEERVHGGGLLGRIGTWW